MKKFITSLLFALLPLTAAFAEPPNLALLQADVIQYHDSLVYEKDLALIIDEAHQYVNRQVEANNHREHKKKLALVLDIDETSISNYSMLVKNHFAADKDTWRQYILTSKGQAIKPMLSLYNDAIKQGVKVFFVTGRSEDSLPATKIMLLQAGYKGWSGLFGRPRDYHATSIVPFKAGVRAKISKKGYVILASMGDQYSDLIGGYAKKGFKLPNPFYFIP